nr:hypothetical protein [Lachnospiraceae bacterium]
MSITVVANNIMAMNGRRQLNINASDKQKSVERLSSGYRINRSADDAAGLSISEKMRKQIRGLGQGARNSQDGVSFCQVADGAMSEVQSMLHRMNELCVQAANGTNSAEDLTSIQNEINQLKVEINRISDTTTFNDMPIFHDRGNVSAGGISDVLGPENVKGGSNFSEPLIVTTQQYHTGMPSNASTEGQPGYAGRVGYPYASVMMDFSGLGSSYTYEQLEGQSFSVTDTSSGKQYGIVFGNSTDTGGRSYIYSGVGDTHTITINVEGCTSGSNLVKTMRSAVGNTSVYTQGGIQFARDSFGKFWIYDNKTANLNNPSVKFASPAGAKDEEKEIWIQSGDVAESGLWITKPYMNANIIGVDGVDVSSNESAKQSLGAVAQAIETVSSLRAQVGAQQNRIEHTINVTNTTKENLEASESKIRDTDMAEETV